MTNSCSVFNRRRVAVAALLALCAAPVYAQNVATGKFITFQVPGNYFVLGPPFVNSSLTVVGSYEDIHSSSHGFVRSPQGTVTTFDVPGAASTNAQSINDIGVVTGAYSDASNNWFGFLSIVG